MKRLTKGVNGKLYTLIREFAGLWWLPINLFLVISLILLLIDVNMETRIGSYAFFMSTFFFIASVGCSLGMLKKSDSSDIFTNVLNKLIILFMFVATFLLSINIALDVACIINRDLCIADGRVEYVKDTSNSRKVYIVDGVRFSSSVDDIRVGYRARVTYTPRFKFIIHQIVYSSIVSGY